MVQVLDGGALSKTLREKLAEEIAAEKLSPGLVVVLVGDNPASQIYVRNKTKAAEKAGIRSQTHHLPASTTQEELLALIDKLNADESVHGILVQLPLPKTIDTERILVAIDPEKDVDGFHPVNAGRLSLGLPGFVPCTPMGCMLLLREATTDTAGKHALVIGRSNIVGKPVAQLLLRANCTVTVAHSGTKDVPSEVSRADILVTAIGDPEFVKGDWIKQGAVIIDVGINRIPDPTKPGSTKIVGDVEFKAACERAAAITPVPGGVGPMTITCLLRNTVQAARARVSR